MGILLSHSGVGFLLSGQCRQKFVFVSHLLRVTLGKMCILPQLLEGSP